MFRASFQSPTLGKIVATIPNRPQIICLASITPGQRQLVVPVKYLQDRAKYRMIRNEPSIEMALLNITLIYRRGTPPPAREVPQLERI